MSSFVEEKRFIKEVEEAHADISEETVKYILNQELFYHAKE